MKICYQERNFKPASLELIAQANEIVGEYLASIAVLRYSFTGPCDAEVNTHGK